MKLKTFTIPTGLTVIQIKNYILKQMAEAMDMHVIGADDETLGMLAMEEDSKAGFTLWSNNTTENANTASIIPVYESMEFGKVRIKGINHSRTITRTANLQSVLAFTILSGNTYYLSYEKTADGVAFFLTNVPTSQMAVKLSNFITKADNGEYAYFSLSSTRTLTETGNTSPGNTAYYMFAMGSIDVLCTSAGVDQMAGMEYSYHSAESPDDIAVLQNVIVPVYQVYFPNLCIPIVRLVDTKATTVSLNTGDEYLVVGNNNVTVATYVYTPVFYLKM